MSLTRMQIAAVKQMAKSLKPIENKIDKLQVKRLEIEQEITAAEVEVGNIHRAIESFTGGLTLQQVLNPEAVPSEQMAEGASIDETAAADMIEATNVFNENVTSPSDNVENTESESTTQGPAI